MSEKQIHAEKTMVLIASLLLAITCSMQATQAQSPYVQVNYQTIGWYWDNGYVGNSTWLLLKVTITNNGYSLVQGMYFIGDAFHVVVSNIVYSTSSVPTPAYNLYNDTYVTYNLCNDSGPQNITGTDLCLSSAQIANEGILAGIIGFKFSPDIFNEPFALQTQFYDQNWNKVSSMVEEIPECSNMAVIAVALICIAVALVIGKKKEVKSMEKALVKRKEKTEILNRHGNRSQAKA